MSPLSSSQGIFRFGDFDVDLSSGELRKHGIRLKLQVQPFQVLQILLEHVDEVVTRKELQNRIWPADTFVDFEQGLNNAVKKLREALSDDAGKPRFIETLSKRGYRFIAPVQEVGIGARAPVGPPAPVTVDSIAVLPFISMSPEPEDEFFADGMTEEIINALAQIQQLHVVARSSAFSFKGKYIDVRAVGTRLNVRTVLLGSVRRAGNELRMTAQLINVEDGYHLWSDRYDREVKDIFEIQDEIARTIAERLKVTLKGAEQGPLVKGGTVAVRKWKHSQSTRHEAHWRNKKHVQTRQRRALRILLRKTKSRIWPTRTQAITSRHHTRASSKLRHGTRSPARASSILTSFTTPRAICTVSSRQNQNRYDLTNAASNRAVISK